LGIGYYIYCDITDDLFYVYSLDYDMNGQRIDPEGDFHNFIG